MCQMLFCYFGSGRLQSLSVDRCRCLFIIFQKNIVVVFHWIEYIIPSDLFSYYGFVGLMDDRNLERWWTRKQGEKLLGLGAAVIQTVYVGKVRELLWRQHDPTQFNVAIGGFNQIIMTITSYHQNTPIYHTVNRLLSGHLGYLGHLSHLSHLGHLPSYLCFQHCDWLANCRTTSGLKGLLRRQ